MPDRPAPTMRTSKCSDDILASLPLPSWPGLSRPSTSLAIPTLKTWMPGTSPGMTKLLACGGERLFSVPVMIRLERAFRLDADIFGLVLAQLGQLDSDLCEVQPRHLLVQRLRQHVDLLLVLAVLVVGPEFDLRQRLVGERRRHHEGRMAHGIAEVNQAAFP